MSSPYTRIMEIIDVTAAIAGGIEGVKATFGIGSELVEDPLHPGSMIAAAGPNVLEPNTHWTDLPETGDLPFGAMVGEHIVTWTLPMKYFVDKGEADKVRAELAPMYRRYLDAFARNVTLRGTARRWSRLQWRLGSDDDHAWLAMTLTLDERLVLPTAA